MRAKLFSVIIDTYFRPQLLKVAVEAVLGQTYENLELVIVDNGATPETREYVSQVAAADRRLKIVRFEQNQYRPETPVSMIETLYNAGLEATTGDYVFYQSDDDVIAPDYVEKMVALFEGHPGCTTAAGLTVSIDIDGRQIPEPRTSNFRPRYCDGHVVALDHLRGGTMFAAPGTIFSFKRDVLLAAGGFHVTLPVSEVFGIVPFGVTGFDDTALFYWRRHAGQLSKQLEGEGYVWLDDLASLLRDWDIEGRWRVFGPDVAREVAVGLRRRAEDSAAASCAYQIRLLRPRPAFRIAWMCRRHRGFWLRLPLAIWHPLREPLMPFRLVMKASLRLMFAVLPRTLSLPPRLQALRARITR